MLKDSSHRRTTSAGGFQRSSSGLLRTSAATTVPPAPPLNRTPLVSPRTIAAPSIATHRLYKAPQAAIRGSETGLASQDNSVLLGNARRRRAHPDTTSTTTAAIPTTRNDTRGFALEQKLSNNSINPNEMPEPPWVDDDDNKVEPLLQSSASAIPEMTGKRSPLRPRRSVRSLHIHPGNEDMSESYLDEDSFAGTYHNHSFRELAYHDKHTHKARKASTAAISATRTINVTAIVQLLVLLGLAGIIYDSHHRVKAHKIRLQQYDEERAHILEQMMWIDQAAKKVHNKYSGLLDPKTESKEQLADETRQLRDELHQLQLRIQLNSRDRIHESFGDRPVQIRLKLPTDDAEIVLALSDDTPHAAATLLQQIEKKLWEEMIFRKLEPGVVEVSSTMPTNTPLLEFVEKSRGCHEMGSVALHHSVNNEITVLVLRVHLTELATVADTDVCIGKIVGGLEHLHNVT